MAYDFDRVIERRHTESSKWRKYDEDVVPLWVADMDFASPEPVIRALRERALRGGSRGPRARGHPADACLPALQPAQPRGARLASRGPPAHGGALPLARDRDRRGRDPR